MSKLTMRKNLLATLIATAMATGPTLANEPDHHHHDMNMADHWMAPAKAANRHNPVPANPASQARGKSLFQTHCAACHGERGEGDGPAGLNLEPKPANLKAMSAHHSDGDLAWKIAHGRGPMPGWNAILTAKQIWDLVNHIRRLGGS